MIKESFNFEKLIVYKEAVIFNREIYRLSSIWPKDEQFGITNQCRRAAVSIVLNIAEGSSRTKRDFMHFLSLSRGSCFEVCACLEIALSLNYITQLEYETAYSKVLMLAKMITSLKKSLTK